MAQEAGQYKSAVPLLFITFKTVRSRTHFLTVDTARALSRRPRLS